MKVLNYNETALGSRKLQRTANVDLSLERLSWLMDDLFRVPVLGWRFGLDALIGLVPGFGDTATSLVSFYILVAAVRYRVPKITLIRMALNLALDYLLGSLPLVGDLFDAWWKANHKNVDLLKDRATIEGEALREARASDWLFVGAIFGGLILLAFASSFLGFYLMLQVSRVLSGYLFF